MTITERYINKEAVRAKEVAKYLGIGLLKPINLSPRVTVFRKSDIDAFILSRIDEVA